MGLAELADALGWSKPRLCNRIRRKQDVPEPLVRLRLGPIWDADTIGEWIAANKVDDELPDADEVW